MTNSSLPDELIDLIIDLLANNEDDLQTCSLVCRSWLTRSRYYLFSDIVLNGKNSGYILDLPQPSAFAVNARRLLLTEQHHFPSSLRHFASVTNLYIHNSTLVGVMTPSIPLSQIISLELNTVIFEAFADIIRILCALPCLEMFTQYMCLWTSERGIIPAGLQLPERLHTLNYVSMNSDLFFGWFGTLNTLPPISTARIYGVAESNMRSVGTAIKRLGSSIQHLTLDLWDHGHAGLSVSLSRSLLQLTIKLSTDLLIDSIDLSHNPSLLSFTLLNAWPKLLRELLHTHAPCSSLQHVSLSIYEGKANMPNLDLLDWSQLDRLASGPETSFRLTDITIRIYAHLLISKVTQEMVTDRFMPLSGSRGLVKYVSERERILNLNKRLTGPISRRSWAEQISTELDYR
ncbi:hypothetical protein H0H92_007838 [Tricholoma furcatifolium]|nr:hypothetical protein H0H92_007838 [Tricholoma furcatifolium]